MSEACKHPAVRVVSRNEDAEFVECVLCGEVFDSEEFEDIKIEEKLQAEEQLKEANKAKEAAEE